MNEIIEKINKIFEMEEGTYVLTLPEETTLHEALTMISDVWCKLGHYQKYKISNILADNMGFNRQSLEIDEHAIDSIKNRIQFDREYKCKWVGGLEEEETNEE